MQIAVLLGVAGLLVYGAAGADYTDRQDVRDYMMELRREYGFNKLELEEVIGSARRRQDVLDLIARPAERTLEWWEYRRIFLREATIDQGLEFWAVNEAILERARDRFGVPAEYVVAIIGVETRWGRIVGRHRVLDALMTLAFDYVPRAEFFRRELTQFLLLAREEGKNPLDLKGSYAGAMGYGQFIPSSYRSYAVDFDGDGLRDIWSNESDAIGSVANYFERHGWKDDGPVVVKVDVASGQTSVVDAVANKGITLGHTVDQLQALGVSVGDLPGDAKAALFRMGLEQGHEYWLGLNNFHVIMRYNRSPLYALAVHQLGQAIKQRRVALTAAR
ncbi:MAG: lytic murein transglycosylase B [Gammaproteobacteria bacterium]|nr:lytic murein transglycosylase B [Gammaproteobacteria bacterium]